MVLDSDKNIFGLDMSDKALRVVQFKKRGKKTVLSSYNEVAIPKDIIGNNQIKQEDALSKLIHKTIKSAKGSKISTKDVVAVLPEQKTFIKVIEISQKPEQKLSELIEEEIKNHIPFDTKDIYLDWQILKQDENTTKLLIGAAPKTIVDSYTSVLEKSGLIPNILEIEAAPVIRSLITQNDQKAKIIIDFGAVRSGLIVYDHGTAQFTVSLPTSGIKITDTISKTLNLDWKKAEKAKMVCGLDQDKCEGALLKILMSAMDQLTAQIKKTIVFYGSNFPESNEISEIILCGGGANFSKIDEVLSDKLNLPVKIGNPFINAVQTKRVSIPKNKILSYATAIGLALRAFQKNK